MHHDSITTWATSETSRQPHVSHFHFLFNNIQFSRPARRMIPQLSKLKSHLRKNTSEPANKPPEALTSPCSPPGPSRCNAMSTLPTCSKSPFPPSPPLTSSRCKYTSCARHTSFRSLTPISSPSTPAQPRRNVTPRVASRSPEQLNEPLRPRRSPTLRQPTRTKTEQAQYFLELRNDEVEEWSTQPPRPTQANLIRAQKVADGRTRSLYTKYMFNAVPAEPVRKRKPSLTQPTRKRAERVAAGDCMGRGCFSAFCATSCAFERPEPAYSRPQFVTMFTEPDIERTLSKPKTNSFWTSIKQIRPIDPTSSKSEKMGSQRRFIKDLIDCLKACGKLLLMAVGCTCVLK